MLYRILFVATISYITVFALQINCENIKNVPLSTELINKNEKENNDNYLNSCNERKRLIEQPVQNENSKIKKCCPHGENLHYNSNDVDKEKNEIEIEGGYCNSQNHSYSFDINVANVILYDRCIEDTEQTVSLGFKIGNPCNFSFIYGAQMGDILYVTQNGSLLILDEYRNESYQIENNYCLDIDMQTGDLYAIVCINSIKSHLNKGQTILFSIFMIFSIPCLLFVTYLHFTVKELRTLHGLSLGCLSISLAIGFFLHAIAQTINYDTDDDNYNQNQMNIGYAVQFFILEYFFWLFILCVNVTITVWLFIPRYIVFQKTTKSTKFGIYCSIATIIPLILVLITKYEDLDGMPSYFYQGWNDSIRSSQRYFIPPVTTILLLSIMFLILTYFGFKQIEKILENRCSIDFEKYKETKRDFKCIIYLTFIIFTTWIFEVTTFYLPSIDDYLAMMEIFNGLQGVFILMIFIGIRNRRHLVMRWWYDRGSLNTEIEMTNLNSK